jgi:hypothetical protein
MATEDEAKDSLFRFINSIGHCELTAIDEQAERRAVGDGNEARGYAFPCRLSPTPSCGLSRRWFLCQHIKWFAET